MILILPIALILIALLFNSYIRKENIKEFHKNNKIISSFIEDRKYNAITRYEKIREYNILIDGIDENSNFRKINKEAKKIFQDVVPEFKAELRQKKIKKILKRWA